jgi:hypothetical protein
MPLNLDALIKNQDAATSQTYFNRINFQKVATVTSQGSTSSNTVIIWEFTFGVILIVSIIIILNLFFRNHIIINMKNGIKNIVTKISSPKTVITIGGALIVLRLIFPVMYMSDGHYINSIAVGHTANFYPIMPNCTTIQIEDHFTDPDGINCIHRVDSTQTTLQSIALALATGVLFYLAKEKLRQK